MASHTRRPALVPRFSGQGYADADVARRREWLEQVTGATLQHVGSSTLAGESLRGNVENPVGSVQVPLGIAGPLKVRGEHAQGVFYVPLATTEGALVRSYERGMTALTRAGGVTVRIHRDENRADPIFFFETLEEAHAFAAELPQHLEDLRREAESTTRHGRLLAVEGKPLGRDVVLTFRYHTGDAHGMNLLVRATEKACGWLRQRYPDCLGHYVLSGHSGEKRGAGGLFGGGKGKYVVAGVRMPARLLRAYFRVTPEALCHMARRTGMAQLHAGTLGYNGHFANGLTALFIATGQDVANVVNSAVGGTWFEVLPDGDLHASVTLPSLVVATVGGGTGLGSSQECLEMLGCFGSGKARKFAEIAAATVLAGELSMGSAIAAGEMVSAHEDYGRNRPEEGS